MQFFHRLFLLTKYETFYLYDRKKICINHFIQSAKYLHTLLQDTDEMVLFTIFDDTNINIPNDKLKLTIGINHYGDNIVNFNVRNSIILN